MITMNSTTFDFIRFYALPNVRSENDKIYKLVICLPHRNNGVEQKTRSSVSSSFAIHAWATAVAWSGFGDNDDNNSRNDNRILQVSFHYTNTYHYYYFRSYCRCGCSFWYVSSALKPVRLFAIYFCSCWHVPRDGFALRFSRIMLFLWCFVICSSSMFLLCVSHSFE